ncbi:UbiA prenyltransferase family protein [Winogradskyella aurantiaca]|uniref:hypothetical protein n=1 Tax=Winogradskyella aurantiaca TaxID=2219558 RepID=UPI000E1C7196|nr:hypothetical protein [Winogradskyella aurantiaca]
MKVLKTLMNFYLNASLHVALAVVSFTYISYWDLQLEVSNTVIGFVFFATVLGYNFVKYLGFHVIFEKGRPTWYRLIEILSIFSLAMVLSYVSRFKSDLLIALCFMTLLTFFYAMPISIKGSNSITMNNLRGLSGVKVFIIATVWTFTTVVIPIMDARGMLLLGDLILVIQRFLWVLILMIPFEIRDLKYDHKSLGTIPQVLGVFNAKIAGYIMLCVICLLEFLKTSISVTQTLILVTVILITALLIWKSEKKQSEYYSSFWVEGIPILWLGLILVFRQF